MHEKKRGSSSGGGHPPYHIQIECVYEDLSDVQVRFQELRAKELLEFKKKFDTFQQTKPDIHIDRGEFCTFVEWINQTSMAHSTTAAIPVVPVSSPQLQKQNGRIPHTAQGPNNQILLVNNQRGGLTGLIVPTSSIPGVTSSSSVAGTPVNVVNVNGTNVAFPTTPVSAGTLLNTVKTPITASKVSSPQLAVSNQSQVISSIPSKSTGTIIVKNRALVHNTPLKRPLDVTVPSSKPLVTVSTPNHPAATSGEKQDVSSGGLSQTKKAKLIYPSPVPTVSIDLTEDLSKIEGAGGPSGKTYPSLVVTARPCMRSEKEAKSPTIVKEKQALDTQVRRVLLFSAQNFTEWLIQIGLLRCDHYCTIHTADDGTKIKLKLGQYTDSYKFPFSGGYVWVSDCCPQTYISVFSGSIFEGASYPPTTTTKLIYHWACHTSIQNILQWVSVSNVYIKNLFTNLRAVCTAAVHEHYEKMGGKGKKIQVGVVSLGTTSKENITKKVRVDILCLFDPETKVVRIRAVEPTPDPDRFVLRKFTKIFEIMPLWVDFDTMILVDNTVERSVLYNMGFKIVSQTTVKDKKGQDQYPNYEVMDYLRQIVPKMFQNTLSILTRQVLQQFLDELCWRERWGPFPSRAFDTIIKHLIEQTKINSGASLLNRLSKISSNPFKDWKYSKWRANCISRPSGSNTSKPSLSTAGGCGGPPQKVTVTKDTPLVSTPAIPLPPDPSLDTEPSPVLLPRSNTQLPMILEAAKILLEPYFYGTINGDEDLQKRKLDFRVNCVICRKLFTNNVELTDHLIKHGLFSGESEVKELCKLCYKVFSSPYQLQQHHGQVHSYQGIPNSSLWCLMCNIRYRDVTSLVTHMNRLHGELELPYACEVCSYKTSIYMQMIGHISECHNSDHTGFCPYCFHCFVFYRHGKPCARNQYRFIYHIQRHQMPMSKKCYKCVAMCINKRILNEHEFIAHKSYANDEEVERYRTSSDTLMPAPLEDPLPPKGDRFKPPVGGPYKVVNFPGPLNVDEKLDRDATCIECDAKLNPSHMSLSHYMFELLCMKCDFTTCCIRAMEEHHHTIHSYSMSKIYKSIPVISDTNLNCSCSYTTKDGNLMATHLVMCKKTTCYMDPVNSSNTDIKSLIGQQACDINNETVVDHDLNLTYTIMPSTSSSKDINNATFIVKK